MLSSGFKRLLARVAEAAETPPGSAEGDLVTDRSADGVAIGMRRSKQAIEWLISAKQILADFLATTKDNHGMCRLVPKPELQHLEDNCFDKTSNYLGKN